MRSSGIAGEAQASPALLASGSSAVSGPYPVFPTPPDDAESSEDQDTGDLPGGGVDEDALDSDDLDTDRIANSL